jgi:excisionase family DNA binding protein
MTELVKLLDGARTARPSIGDLAAKPLLKLDEACELTGLSRQTLREAIEAGTLKAQIIGRAWRVKRDDLNRYLKNL